MSESERRRGMHARVSTFEGPSEKVDELSRIATERVVPSLKQMDGYRGVLALADRRSGKVLAVTLWESEEAMLQSEGAADRLRSDSASRRRNGSRRGEIRGRPLRAVRDTQC
jgi:heme-degrading monooxygenase HmoA